MKSYVYAHVLPDTGEVIYIGQGQQERAWSLSRRSDPHCQILTSLQLAGHSPADYTVVLAQGLSPESAALLELHLIRTIRPLLNQQGNGAANAGRGQANRNSVLTDEKVQLIRTEHATGMYSLRALGRRHGVAYTTARKVVTRTAWAHIN